MNVDELMERPAKHLMEDGVVEMVLGVQFFLGGAIFWFGSTLRLGSSIKAFYSFGQSVLFILVCLACSWSTKRLKERLIAPRAGYVIPREEEIDIRISARGVRVDSTTKRYAVAAGALLLGTVGLLSFEMNRTTGFWSHVPPRWHWAFGPLCALLAAGYFGWAGLRHEMPRYFWLAAWAVTLGVCTLARGRDPFDSVLLMMTGLAGGCAVLGAVQLRNFLKANPRADHD